MIEEIIMEAIGCVRHPLLEYLPILGKKGINQGILFCLSELNPAEDSLKSSRHFAFSPETTYWIAHP